MAESIKLYRATILSLGPHLPEADLDLDQLLAGLVTARNDLAFPRIVLAALAAGRPVDARHLVEGAALFPGPEQMANAAWHWCSRATVCLSIPFWRSPFSKSSSGAFAARLWSFCRRLPLPWCSRALPCAARPNGLAEMSPVPAAAVRSTRSVVMTLFEVVRRGSKPLLERLLRLNPEALQSLDYKRLTIDLLLAGDEGRQQLDLKGTGSSAAGTQSQGPRNAQPPEGAGPAQPEAGRQGEPPASREERRRSPTASTTSPISPTRTQPRCAPATGPDRIRGQGSPGTHRIAPGHGTGLPGNGRPIGRRRGVGLRGSQTP